VADRTSELRKKGFEGRRLGPKQMTTDTAVRVTRMVVQEKGMTSALRSSFGLSLCADSIAVPLDQIPYLDFPELKFNEHESTQMPFRYVRGENGTPIMPSVRNATLALPSNFWQL
jgi:ribosome biogenesis SPOUT family RNA methylase Rps3